MTRPTDTESPKASDQDSAKTAVDDNIAPDSVSTDSDQDTRPAPKKKTHGMRNAILMLLFIFVAVVAALALSGKLMPLYESLTARLHHSTAQQHESDTSSAGETQQPPQSEHSKPTTSVSQSAAQQPKPEQAPEIAALQQQSEAAGVEPGGAEQNGAEKTAADQPRLQQPDTISSEQAQALLASMQELRRQLQQMSAAQQTLQNGLKEQQQMNLQVRLRWIVDPASRLPQLQLAWEEISLLPGLSNSQRSEAVRMHKLARARVQQLKQWQDALNKWADALATPVQRNVLPQPQYPWLAWIVSQFKLRPAPSVEARHLNHLRARLLDAARHLTLESWPAKGEWQSLQAELLLQIRAMQHGAHANAEAIEIGLPESFDAIQADIKTLRHTALQWQHGGVQ